MPLNTDLVFSLIRLGLDVETDIPGITEEEFSELKQLGIRQSILPIIYRGLQKTNTPKAWMDSLEKEKDRCIIQHIFRQNAIDQLASTLDETEIAYILLKGATICELYPEPWMRTSSDIDILVPEQMCEIALRTIEEKTKFQFQKKSYHDYSLIDHHIHLELHYSLKENEERIDPLLREAWDYAAPKGKGQQYCFSPEYLIFYITAHMLHHFLNGGLGIRPFLDLWLLRTKLHYNEEEINKLFDRCGMLAFYVNCCRLTEVWMSGADHTKTTEQLEHYVLQGGVFGSDSFRYLARQRKHTGLKYLLSRVFPSKYQVREYYNNNGDDDAHSFLYYYAKRLKSWLGKERRSKLIQQIKAVRKSDHVELQKAQELMKELGLSDS